MKLTKEYLVAVTTTLVLSICAGTFADEGADTSKSRRLEEAGKAWAKAVREADKAAMDRILTEDYLHVGADGKVSGKKATINALTAGNFSVDSKLQDNVRVRVYDKNAIVTGRQVIAITRNGTHASLEVRDVACWVLGNDGWQLEFYQATPVRQ